MLDNKLIFLSLIISCVHGAEITVPISTQNSNPESDYNKLTEQDIAIFHKAVDPNNFKKLFAQHSELGLKRLLQCAQSEKLVKDCWHHIIRNYHLYEDPEHNDLKEKVRTLMDDKLCLAYYADPNNRMQLSKEDLIYFRKQFPEQEDIENFTFLQGYTPNEYLLPMVNYNKKYFSEQCKFSASTVLYNKAFFILLSNNFETEYEPFKAAVLNLYKELKCIIVKEK